MNVLLDSHVVFWVMSGDPKISDTAAIVLGDANNECFVSPVNHWEMAIKISVGKYIIKDDFEALWRDALKRFRILPIEPRHTAQLISMPFRHKDPFDRLLIAQAPAEHVPLVSADPAFDVYGITRIW